MKRELFLHFAFWFSFFVFITLFKQYFNLSYWPFWVGGIIGTILPDLDHIIYFYLVSPTDLTSQRFNFLLQKKEIGRMISLLYETRNERTGLIFHTFLFQVIFLVLTFWLLTSSGSIFGRGLVLAFSMHMIIDQLIDLNEMGNLSNWTKNFPFVLDEQKTKIYWVGMLVINLLIGFFL
jgi:hypothetical protein